MCIFLEQASINFNQMALLFTHPTPNILRFSYLRSLTQPLNLSKLTYNWDIYSAIFPITDFHSYMMILLFLDLGLKIAHFKRAFNP